MPRVTRGRALSMTLLKTELRSLMRARSSIYDHRFSHRTRKLTAAAHGASRAPPSRRGPPQGPQRLTPHAFGERMPDLKVHSVPPRTDCHSRSRTLYSHPSNGSDRSPAAAVES